MSALTCGFSSLFTENGPLGLQPRRPVLVS